MSTSRIQAVLMRLVPSVALIGLVLATLFGTGGVLDTLRLRGRAQEARATWVQTERETDRLLLEVRQLQEDPVAVERLAADALHVARPGATLYVFDDDDRVATPLP